MKIIKNPDEEIFQNIKKKVLDNDGYCPCALEKIEDYKCPCKDFRFQEEEGFCHCGLYQKVRSQD